MDITSTLGAVVGVIDVVARTVLALAKIRKQFKDFSLTLEVLHGQLLTLETALGQVRSLIEESLHSETHHSLASNLGTSVDCCGLLMNILSDHIEPLEGEKDDGIVFKKKLNLILETPSIKECLTQLGQLTTALHLIITAFHTRELLQQQRVLEKGESLQVFQQVKDSSSSLLMLYDKASLETSRTRTTTTTSKYSVNFAFDGELLQHKIYKGAFRSLMKNVKTSEVDAPVDVERLLAEKRAKEAINSSWIIDKGLRKSSIQRKREVRILCLGPCSAHIPKLMKLKATPESPSKDELSEYQVDIYRYMLSELQSAIENSNNADRLPYSVFHGHREVVSRALGGEISIPLKPRIQNSCRWFSEREFIQSGLSYPASHFVRDIDRILSANYVPSDRDVALLPSGTDSSVQDHWVAKPGTNERIVYKFTELIDGSTIERKCLHQLEDITITIFTVDLACYAMSETASKENRMVEALRSFERWGNFPSRERISNILVFYNAEGLQREIGRKPLKDVFEDFNEGNDPIKAQKYIEQRFRQQVRREYLELYTIQAELDDDSLANTVVYCIEQSIVQYCLNKFILRC